LFLGYSKKSVNPLFFPGEENAFANAYGLHPAVGTFTAMSGKIREHNRSTEVDKRQTIHE
jgi:hypothetical protein